MKSLRLSEWALGVLLAVAFIIVAGFLWFYWRQPAQQTSEPKIFTAREAYKRAEPVAINWANDAKMVTASTTWNMDEQGEFTKFGWSFVYYAPSQSATALISVSEADTSLLGTQLAEKKYSPSETDQWEIDSPVIIEDLLSIIDPTLMESMGGGILTLTLNMLETPTWFAEMIHLESGKYFSLEIDANSGRTIDIQQVQ